MNIEKLKKSISLLVTFIGTYCLVIPKMNFIIPFIIFIILFAFNFNEIKKYIMRNLKLIKSVFNKEKFYISEKSKKTDLKSRQKISWFLYWCVNITFLFIVLLFKKTNLKISIIEYLVLILTVLAVITILILVATNYPNISFYSIPILLGINALIYINVFKNYEIIIYYILIGVILYLPLVCIIPSYYLRNINNLSIMIGIILAIFIPLSLNYIIPSFFENIVTLKIPYEIKIQDIKQLNVSDNFISILKENPIILDFINSYKVIYTKIMINEQTKILNMISFMYLSIYSIGGFIVKLKLKLSDLKAQDYYEKLLSLKNDDEIYNYIKICNFYGDINLKNIILLNEEYRNIIKYKEKNIEFYIEENKYLVVFNKIKKILINFLKKII